MKALSFLVFLFICCASSLYGQGWIVHFDDKIHLKDNSGLELLSAALNIYQYKPDRQKSRKKYYNHLSEAGNILHLYPNYEVEYRDYFPNDELYDEQWNLEIIGMPQAWDETTGGNSNSNEKIIIALMDDGLDTEHSDLSANIWTNDGEIPGDGLDNDNNGYVDDYEGVNIQDKNDIHPRLDHGTKVAGILGATGDNNLGIAGINWNSHILALSGVTNVAEIITAYEYIYNLKLKFLETDGAEGANIVVTNFSAGISQAFPSDFPGWCNMYDLLGTVGILSIGSTANEDIDVAFAGDLPSLCPSEYLIIVTNTNVFDVKVTAAATSRYFVDLGAPGSKITTLDLNNDYGLISGTSASAPHVAGAVALLYATPCEKLPEMSKTEPAKTALKIKDAIMSGVDTLISLENTVSKGRLNVYRAMTRLSEICGDPGLSELNVESVRSSGQKGQYSLEIKYETDSFSEHQLHIFDTMGRNVYSQSFNPNLFEEKLLNINGLNLPSALYVISISNENNLASKLFSFTF